MRTKKTSVNKYSLPPSKDGSIFFAGRERYHSWFNPKWFSYLKVTPNVIFDVGACSGGDTANLHESYPECLFYSFEASPYFYKQLKEMSSSKISVYHAAVTDSDGPVEFMEIARKDTQEVACGSLLKVSEKYSDKAPNLKQLDPITVPGIRLETFCLDRGIDSIGLLHVDVEGAVIKVLKGLGKIRPRFMNIEMNNLKDKFRGFNKDEVENYIGFLGYSLICQGPHDNLYERV